MEGQNQGIAGADGLKSAKKDLKFAQILPFGPSSLV
jgi:hypothetical protein